MADNKTTVVLEGEDRTGGMFSSFQRNLSASETASNGLKSAMGALGLSISAVGMMALVKGAIDSADSLKDLSKSTHLTVSDLAGLKLAAKQSGTDIEGVAASVNKLSVNMGKNAEKFAAIGITAKDPLEAFKQLADVFVSIEDPQQQAAFGAEALGKSWASAAPLLAEGSAKIGEMVEKGKKLSGVTEEMAARAAEFNDMMAVTSTRLGGIGTGVATQVLPGLNEWLGVVDKLIEKHGLLLGGLAGIGAGIAKMTGQPITELALAERSAANAFADLAQARKKLEQAEGSSDSDFGSSVRRTAVIAAAKKQVEDYTVSLKTAVGARDALLDKPKPAAADGKPASSPDLKAFLGGDKAKKEVDDYARITQSIAKLTAEISAEDAALEPLLKSEKLALDLMVEIGTGKTKLTTAQKISTVAALEEAIAKEKIAVATKKSAKERELEQKALAAENTARWGTIDALDTEIKSLQISGEEIGLTVEQLNAVRLARMDAAIATKEHTLAVEEATAAGGSNVEALKIEIEQLKQIRNQTAGNQGRQAAADIAKINLDEQVGMWKSIETTAHDTFVSIANAGKDTWTRLKESGKNIFFDWLYQMTLKKWLINIAASFGGTGGSAWAQSLGGGGSAVGTGSNLMSTASNAYSLYTSAMVPGGAALGAGVYSAGSAFGSASMMGYGAGIEAASLGAVGSGATVYGAAGATGSAAFAEGAAAATGGATSALAAIPVWGWIAIAAIAAYAIFSKPGGGPKVEGDYSGTFGADGAIDANVTAGQYTGHSADDQLAAMAPGIGAGIYGYIKSMGGDASGIGFSYGYNTDPLGDAPDNVNTGISKNGQSIYNYTHDADRGKGLEALTADIPKMMIAAAKVADGLPAIITALASSIDLTAATTEQVNALLTHISEANTILQYGDANPLEGFIEQARIAGRTLMDVWNESGTSLNTLISAYDGSAAATHTLSAATQNQYQLELQLIGQIQNALSSTHAMFGNSIEAIRMSVMDDPAKYDYLRTQADDLYAQLATATDPAKIQALADKIDKDINAAWGLLGNEQRPGAASEFESYLTSVDTLTADRLALQQDLVLQNHDNLAATIQTAMDAVAAKMMAAAEAMMAAVVTPPPRQAISVDFHADIPGDVEVSLV